MPDETPCIYIVDDDQAMRESIAFLVSSVGYSQISCESAAEFLKIYDRLKPGCLILDVRLPGMSGLELQRELNGEGCNLGIIFISGHGDIPMAVRSIRNGAIDFLEKPFDDQLLLDQIDKALRVSAEALLKSTRQADAERKLSCLTDREREVMSMVVDGKTNKAIALDLNISVKTVENHRANLMAKANVSSVAELIAWAADTKASR